MPTLELSCSGQASEKHPAQLATVHVSITARDSDNEVAVRRTMETSNSILQDIKTHRVYSQGVEKVHLQRLTTYNRRENDSKGAFSSNSSKSNTIYFASTTITITYTNFDDMSKTVPYLAKMKLVSIESIQWSLSPSTIALLKGALREKATLDAIQNARAFFHASGVDEMHLVKLKDIVSGIPAPSGMVMHARQRAANFASNPYDQAPSLSFEPEDIETTVEILCEFEAEAPKIKVH